MAYADLCSELSGYFPGLSPFLAENWINRAYRDIRDARLWSFLITDDAVVCPTALNQGFYNITQYNNVVVADAIASAAFATISPVILPPQFLQLRFGGQGQTSQIYNIASVDTTNPSAYVFTLTRVVEEPTNPASQYLCYRNYVAAPVPDFLRWLSVVDMENGWKLFTDRTSWGFDAIDPQRQSLGLAYYLGSYKASDDSQPTSSQPIFELWPGPTQGQTFYVRYRRRGADLSAPTDVQNDVIPDELIIQKALIYGYQWAELNKGHFPALAKANILGLMDRARGMYVTMLREAKRQDDNTMLQSVFNRGHGLRDKDNGFPWPIDAAFLQSHLVPLV